MLVEISLAVYGAMMIVVATSLCVVALVVNDNEKTGKGESIDIRKVTDMVITLADEICVVFFYV